MSQTVLSIDPPPTVSVGQDLQHVCGDPHECQSDGREVLCTAEAPLLHHADQLPGAHQPLLADDAGQEKVRGILLYWMLSYLCGCEWVGGCGWV